MTRRMWTTGLAAGACLALGTLIAALVAGSAWPVLQALAVYLTVVIALVAVHVVERVATVVDEWQVNESIKRRYKAEAPRG